MAAGAMDLGSPGGGMGMGGAFHLPPMRHSRSGPARASDELGYGPADGIYRPLSRVDGPPSRLPRPPVLGGVRPQLPPMPAYNYHYGADMGGGGGMAGGRGGGRGVGLGGGGGGGAHGHQHSYGPPPKSRYQSFFNLDHDSSAPPPSYNNGNARAGGARSAHNAPQPVQAQGPALAFGKRGAAPGMRPPPSPAILRGDHLPSPVKKSRAQEQPKGRAAKGSAVGAGPGHMPTVQEAPSRKPRLQGLGSKIGAGSAGGAVSGGGAAAQAVPAPASASPGPQASAAARPASQGAEPAPALVSPAKGSRACTPCL